MPSLLIRLAALAATTLSLVLGAGCISVSPVTIGQKTSLERQLIGEMEPLTEEEILASSVRAPQGAGAGSLDDLQQRALSARRRQLFNRDDLDELKADGCVGEDTGARLVPRECDGDSDPERGARLERLIQQENEDRNAIIDWAVAADPVLTPSERDEVVRVYQRLLRERASDGHWLRNEDGEWSRKGGGT